MTGGGGWAESQKENWKLKNAAAWSRRFLMSSESQKENWKFSIPNRPWKSEVERISKRELKVSEIIRGADSEAWGIESQKENWKNIYFLDLHVVITFSNLKKRIESNPFEVDVLRRIYGDESQKENWKLSSSIPPHPHRAAGISKRELKVTALSTLMNLYPGVMSESQKENWKLCRRWASSICRWRGISKRELKVSHSTTSNHLSM